jgi:hypothetical protein
MVQTARIFIIIHVFEAHDMSTRPVYLSDNPCNAIYLVFYDVWFVRERGIRQGVYTVGVPF